MSAPNSAVYDPSQLVNLLRGRLSNDKPIDNPQDNTYIAFPSSLDIKLNPRNSAIDPKESNILDVVNTVSDTEISKYENVITELNRKTQMMQDVIYKNADKICKLVEEYHRLDYAKTHKAQFPSLDFNLVTHNISSLDDKTISVLSMVHSLFSNDTSTLDIQLQTCLNTINVLKQSVETDLKSLTSINAEKLSTQVKLMQAQTNYIRAFSANPSQVLSGDEILRNYMENEILGDYD